MENMQLVEELSQVWEVIQKDPGIVAIAVMFITAIVKIMRTFRVDKNYLFPLTKMASKTPGLTTVILGLPTIISDILLTSLIWPFGVRRRQEKWTRDVDDLYKYISRISIKLDQREQENIHLTDQLKKYEEITVRTALKESRLRSRVEKFEKELAKRKFDEVDCELAPISFDSLKVD